MEEVRAIKVEKYMEFSLDGSLFKNGFTFLADLEPYKIGVDLSRDANIFCGIKEEDKVYSLMFDTKDFNNYVAVFRILSWSKEKDKETYYVRVLKSNKNEEVDFAEEENYLKSFIRIV